MRQIVAVELSPSAWKAWGRTAAPSLQEISTERRVKEPYAKPVIGKVTGPAPLRGGAERRDDRREVLTCGQRDIHGRGRGSHSPGERRRRAGPGPRPPTRRSPPPSRVSGIRPRVVGVHVVGQEPLRPLLRPQHSDHGRRPPDHPRDQPSCLLPRGGERHALDAVPGHPDRADRAPHRQKRKGGRQTRPRGQGHLGQRPQGDRDRELQRFARGSPGGDRESERNP